MHKGPYIFKLRFRTRKQLDEFRRAAKLADESMNKFAIRALDSRVKAIQPPALQQDSVA